MVVKFLIQFFSIVSFLHLIFLCFVLFLMGDLQ